MLDKIVKKRPSMIGNKNTVKEVVKDDNLIVRIYHEDKLKLKKYCKDNNLTQSDYLINSMVDHKILPETRRIEPKQIEQENEK